MEKDGNDHHRPLDSGFRRNDGRYATSPSQSVRGRERANQFFAGDARGRWARCPPSPQQPTTTTTVPSPARRERARVRASGRKWGSVPPTPIAHPSIPLRLAALDASPFAKRRGGTHPPPRILAKLAFHHVCNKPGSG